MFRVAKHASRGMVHRAGGGARPASGPSQTAHKPPAPAAAVKSGGPPMPAPKQRGGLSAAAIGGATVAAGLGATIGYAWLDPGFRDSLEATVPFADVPLGVILGEKRSQPPPAPMPDVPSRMRVKPKPVEPRTDDSTKSAAAAAAAAAAGPSAAAAAPTAAAGDQQSADAADVAAPTPSQSQPAAIDEAARAEQRAQALEAEAAAENLALEHVLQELRERAQMALDVAVDAQQRAATAVVAHVERVFRSLDEASEADWSAVKDSAEFKSQLCLKAEQLSQSAREYLEKLDAVVEESRRNKVTAANPLLTAVQETLSNAYYRLDSAHNKVAAALSEARVMEEFRQLVDESRTKFQQELSSIVPGAVLSGDQQNKLNEEELNVLLVHAYRKVLYLQKELARMLTVEQQKFSTALQRQRDELQAVFDDKITTEISRQHRQAEVRHQQTLDSLQAELENEMRQQLRRQAGAHADHLQDVLAVQERELARKFESLYADQLRTERAVAQGELALMHGELRAVRDAITARANLDKAAHHAQEMWVACQALKQAIRNGRSGASTWQGQLKPLRDEVAAIKQVAGVSSPFVEAVLSALPAEAVERGVYTEDAMRERFFKVERLCRRVSMIDERGGSLVKYALSYLQSLLVVDAFERLPSKEQRDEPINTEGLSTYEIVARARYCIDKDDLVQAVRYLSLLRGEPRLVAADWVRETRLLLEARQAADALLAHAAATGLQAL